MAQSALWTLFLVLFVSSSLNSVIGNSHDIWLRSTSSVIWDGDCRNNCQPPDYCRFAAGTITTNTVAFGVDLCTIHIETPLAAPGGAWIYINNDPDFPTNIIVNPSLILSADLRIYTKGLLNITGRFQSGAMTLGPVTTALPSFGLVGSSFKNNPITIDSGVRSVNVTDSTISRDNGVLFTVNSPPSLSPDWIITGSILQDDSGPSYALFGGNSLGNVEIKGGSVVYVGPTLSSAPYQAIFGLISIVDNSTLFFSPSGTPLAPMSLLPIMSDFSLQVAREGRIMGPWNDTAWIELNSGSILLSNAAISRVNLVIQSQVSVLFENTFFNDSTVRIEQVSNTHVNPVIKDTLFEFNTPPFGDVLLLGSSATRFHLPNVTVKNNNPQSLVGGSLILDSDMTFRFQSTRESAISTTKLQVQDATIAQVGSLLVTHSVQDTSGPAAGMLCVAEALGGMDEHVSVVWTFDSIRSIKMPYNMTGLNTLHYRATIAHQGILQLPLPPPLIIAPVSITITWADPFPPQSNRWYPVASNFSEPIVVVGFDSSSVPAGHQAQNRYHVPTGLWEFRFFDPLYVPEPSEPSEPSAPFEPFFEPYEPSAPSAEPLSLPASPVSNCPQPIPTGFTCVNGQLVSIGNVEEPTITIPPNSGTVQVNGNLTSETVVFDGIGSTLNISGCATIPGGIVIELKGNEQNLPNGPIVLVTQSEDCFGSLLDVPVRIEQTKSCKKTKVSQDPSATKSSLTVLFNVDSSSCNTRWIILGSVLGGIAVLAAVGMIVGKVLYDKRMKAT